MAVNTYLLMCNLALTQLGVEDLAGDVETPGSEANDILCNRVYEQIRDEVLKEHNWQFAKRTLPLNLADGTAEALYDEVDITGITQADPAVVTANSHGFLDGWLVLIDDVVGMTEINGKIVRVDGKTSNTFNCYGVNSAKFTAYSSGGKAIRYEAIGDYESGYVYDVPGDYLKAISLHPAGYDFEEVGSGNSRRILTTIEDAIMVYTAQVTTASEFSSEFVSAYVARLAAELAHPLTKDRQIEADRWEIYNKVLEDAKLADCARSKIEMVEQHPTLSDGGYTL